MKSWQELSWLKRSLIVREPIDPKEHIVKLKTHLENLSDAFLRRSDGVTKKIVATNIALRVTAYAGTAPAMMTFASFVGTASTGTAISSLSGAAWTSSVLAWLGGSVATGTLMVTTAPFLVSLGAAYLARDKIKQFFSNERDIAVLPEEEKILADGLEGILSKLKTKGTSAPELISLWQLNIDPMITKIETLTESQFKDWRWNNLRKLKRSLTQLKKLQDKTEYRLSNKARFSVSAFAATVTKLFLENVKFTEADFLVMDAFRRSTKVLSDASPEEIGEYISQFPLEARQGMLNNVKGIYHELAFAYKENNDGDHWMVELSTKTNEPGVDVWLVNEITGEKNPFQLKATDNLASATKHYEENPDIPILGNEELAIKRDDVVSSGFSNSGLTEQVRETTDKLAEEGSTSQVIEESMTAAAAAAFITYTISLGVELKTGKKITEVAANSLKPAKQSFIIGATLATITELMI